MLGWIRFKKEVEEQEAIIKAAWRSPITLKFTSFHLKAKGSSGQSSPRIPYENIGPWL
jgi:hypothetical protein